MKKIVCHKLVAETAKAMAAELFEHAMQNNARFRAWREVCDAPTEAIRKRYVQMAYPKLIEQARATLAKLLTTNMDESLKRQIHDALIADNMLRIGRRARGQTLN